MAKVTGPLMSMSASGTVGDTITFDKRGFVRQRVIPANPQTDEQGNTRQKLLAVQKALAVMGAAVIALVKAIAPVSYRWNSYLLQQSLGPGSSAYDASVVAFNALTADQRDDWDDAAIAAGIVQQGITYATDAAVRPGLALFVVARALFALGINVGDGAPGAANQTEWGNFFAS
jgi:hypothetical protein